VGGTGSEGGVTYPGGGRGITGGGGRLVATRWGGSWDVAVGWRGGGLIGRGGGGGGGWLVGRVVLGVVHTARGGGSVWTTWRLLAEPRGTKIFKLTKLAKQH